MYSATRWRECSENTIEERYGKMCKDCVLFWPCRSDIKIATPPGGQVTCELNIQDVKRCQFCMRLVKKIARIGESVCTQTLFCRVTLQNFLWPCVEDGSTVVVQLFRFFCVTHCMAPVGLPLPV